MTLLDLSIIYLSLGAPIGVYYFFKQTELKSNFDDSKIEFIVFTKTLLVFIFWVLFILTYCIQNIFLPKSIDKNRPFRLSDASPDDIQNYQQNIINLTRDNNIISLFEIRENLERYIGLSKHLAHPIDVSFPNSPLFEMSFHPNHKLGTLCLLRNNQVKLRRHLTNSRNDLKEILKSLIPNSINPVLLIENLQLLAFSLDDKKLILFLEQFLVKNSQITANSIVSNQENEIWEPNIHKAISS